MRCYEVTEMYALIDISNQMLAVIGSPSHIMGASASGSFAFHSSSQSRRLSVTRYDRCAHTFFSAICIAATVAFWL
jgi:hypothetical protein